MTTLDPITRTVYEFIRDYLRDKRISPTQREIGEGCHIAHTSTLTHLARLEGMAWIERDHNVPRSIRLGELAPDYDPETDNA